MTISNGSTKSCMDGGVAVPRTSDYADLRSGAGPSKNFLVQVHVV